MDPTPRSQTGGRIWPGRDFHPSFFPSIQYKTNSVESALSHRGRRQLSAQPWQRRTMSAAWSPSDVPSIINCSSRFHRTSFSILSPHSSPPQVRKPRSSCLVPVVLCPQHLLSQKWTTRFFWPWLIRVAPVAQPGRSATPSPYIIPTSFRQLRSSPGVFLDASLPISTSSTHLEEILLHIQRRLDDLDRKADDLNRELDLLFTRSNTNPALPSHLSAGVILTVSQFVRSCLRY